VTIVCYLLTAYYFVLLIRIIWSWLPVPRSGPLRVVYEIVYDLTEPVLKLVRGVVPTVRMGAMGLDLSPIVVFVVLSVLQFALCA
jgi:YggT family protein